MEPEIVADYENEVGEGPMWHPMDKRLYWGDIHKGRIFWFDPATEKHELFYEGDSMIGGYTIQEDGSLLLFMEKGAIAELRDGKLKYLIEELPGEGESRFNDVIADPAGRVFCGTMPVDANRAMAGERLGTLYRLDTDGSITPVLGDRGISNGMGFTPDRKQMYYTESMDYKIYIFDYDINTGAISNQRVFVETPSDQGVPDGMTVDAGGYVWSAHAGGSKLTRYTPQGAVERVIPFPTQIVSSVAFGGADMADIFVTTIGGDDRATYGPGSGALFRLQLGIKGVPEFYSRIRV